MATETFIKIAIKSGSTVAESVGKSLAEYDTWETISQEWTVNPADSESWEWTDIDALQIGVSLSMPEGYASSRCTQVYVEVDYTPPPPEEYFNSYIDGDLNGQGGWSGDASFDVSTAGAKEGRKGVQNADTSGNNKDIAKTWVQRNDGRIAIYLKRTNTDKGQTLLVLNEGANERVAVGLYSDGHIKYKNSSGNYVNLGTDTTYSADTWYLLEVEWRSSDHKIRIFVDGVQKQDWVAPASNWTSYLDKVVLRVNQTAGTSYWDYISEFGTSVNTSNWSYAKRYKIDHTKIDENLTNFPVLIKIDNTKPNYQHFFDNAGTGGSSVRFVSSLGTSQAHLKFEKVRFDATNKKAEYFVKIPSVSKDNDTYFYLLYGRTGALDGSDKTEVYGDEFKAVYHMKDDPDTSHIKDSTINGNNGTKKAQNEPIEADGKVAKAQSFDGTNDRVALANAIPGGSSFTVEGWIYRTKTSTTVDGNNWITGNSTPNYSWFSAFTNTDQFSVYYYGSGWKNLGEVGKNNWYYVAFVIDGASGATNNLKGYKDGSLLGQTTMTYTLSSTTSVPWIGGRSDGERYFGGIIDEVRISNVARSAAWIKASYNSGNNSLVSYGSEEAIITNRRRLLII